MPSTLTVREERRSRSKSPSGRDRDRSHSRDTRAKSPPKKERKKSKYSESESEESEDYERRHREKRSTKKYRDESDDDRHRRSSKKYSESESEEEDYKRSSKSKKRYDEEEDRRKGKKDSKSRKKGESEESGSEDINISIHRSHKEKKEKSENGRPSGPPPPGYPPYPNTGYPPDPRQAYQDHRHASYTGPDPRYDPRNDPRYDPHTGYLQGHTDRPDHQRTHSFSAQGAQYVTRDNRDKNKQYIKTYNSKGEEQFVEIQPAKGGRSEKDEKKYREDKYRRESDVSKRMTTLAVGGGLGAGMLGGELARHGSHDGGRPPASPMLEAYRGTYQSISPMPGALVLSRNDSDVSDLDGLSSDSSNEKDELKRKIKKLEKEKKRIAKLHQQDEKEIDRLEYQRDRTVSDASLLVSPSRKRVTFYDPVPDAKKIASALAGSRPPDTKVLLLILPSLTTDDLFALRNEYKNQVKIAGQGINIAKHIKMRVTGNLGKVIYATALGRWESEAYFANSYYFSGTVRRELLIESLMGRPNGDIREIKRVFKDKKYDDDLVKCMKAELKADKFRTAILLALDERRALESELLDIDVVQSDASKLYRALTAGSETAMIEIIVVRSDAHLREVLRLFEDKYNINFAREMISKSRNLVVSHTTPYHLPPKTTLTPHPGRDLSPHPQRRPQPPHARRHAPAPSHLRNRPRQRTRRTPHQPRRASALGTAPPRARQGRVPEPVSRAGGRGGETGGVGGHEDGGGEGVE